jgi:hypothetical protein
VGVWAKVKQVKASVAALSAGRRLHTTDSSRQTQTASRSDVIDESGMQGYNAIWASELLDEDTCEKCAQIDQHEYNSMAEAKAEYPLGGYKDCKNQSGCRGTLVFLQLDTVQQSGMDPKDRVTGQMDIPDSGTASPPERSG